MRVNRKIIKICYKHDENDDKEPAQLTKAEALSFVWELTKEVYSLSKDYDVESRLQRNVVSVTRK